MRRAGLLALALLANSTAALAQVPSDDRRLLELWIDGRNTGRVVTAVLRDKHVLVPFAAIKNAGIKVTGDGDVDLTSLPGVTVEVDEPDQRLLLTVPSDALNRQVYDLRPAITDSVTPSATTGAVLNYDFSASADDTARLGRSVQAGTALSLDVFTPFALFSANGFVDVGSGARGARLDTTAEFDDPDSLSRVLVGDAVSGSLDWSRAVRFAGVEYARDFSLRPSLVTIPLPAFFGDAAVPTTVDVYSGSAHVFEQDLQPGPFELRDLPVVTGAGTATIVTTDVLGRQATQSVSLYTTADLLAPGLTSFAFDAGFLRRGYGERSFDYDQPILSGTLRYGAGETVTIEGHGEASPGLGMAGFGVATGIGAVGAFSVDGAISTSGAGTGWLGSATFQASGDGVSAFGALTVASANFRDLASLGDGAPQPRLRYQLGLSTEFGHGGSAAINWIGTRPTGGKASSFVSASYSQSWDGGLVTSVTALRDLISNQWSLQAGLTLPLGDAYGSVSGLDTAGHATLQASYDDPVNPDGGFGYRVLGEGGDTNRGEIDASYLGTHARLDGAAAVSDGRIALRTGALGALVLMGGGMFATRDTGGAVALVDAGQAGVRVYRENRAVAVSDADGQALLTHLDSNADNHISVDPRDYPMTALLAVSDRVVAPRRRSGIVVDFAPVSFSPAFLTVETGSRHAPPAGTRVDVIGDTASLLMGHDGQLFVPDLKTASDAEMVVGGKRCLIHMEPRAGGASAHPDALLCLREADDAD